MAGAKWVMGSQHEMGLRGKAGTRQHRSERLWSKVWILSLEQWKFAHPKNGLLENGVI